MSELTPSIRKRNPASVSFGERGSKVCISPDPASGIYQMTWRDQSRPGYHYFTRSLHTRDRRKACALAKEHAGRLMAGEEQSKGQAPHLAHILSLYLSHWTPRKVRSEQQADHRRAKMWARWLGPKKDLSKLSLREWDTFIEARRDGRIDATGESVALEDRKPVRDGTVWGDLVFLLGVINWAVNWRENDRYLLSENVARGFGLPREKNVRRPVVTPERFERVRAVADQVMMRVGRGRDRQMIPSYLPELIDLAWHCGRRISAILALRYSDLRLESTTDCPHGAVVWPAETDKMGVEWTAPLNPLARAALNRIRMDRQLAGSPYVFPHPNKPDKPLSKDLATAWLLKAETLAGVGHLAGGSWHPYRRGWATARKHLPVADVARAGGWTDQSVLAQVYQQSDSETLLRVVNASVKTA